MKCLMNGFVSDPGEKSEVTSKSAIMTAGILAESAMDCKLSRND